MPLVRLALLPRFIVYTASIVLTLLLAVLMRVYPGHTNVLFLLLVISGGLAVLGTHDLVQTKHSVLRNYPVTAHLRFLLEEVRPELRQYFLKARTTGRRFPETSARSYISAQKWLSTSDHSARTPMSTERLTNGSIIRWLRRR
jgi:hypothetical protein